MSDQRLARTMGVIQQGMDEGLHIGVQVYVSTRGKVIADVVVGEALRGVAMGAEMPLSLRGAHPSLAIADLACFGVAGGRDPSLSETFSRMYRTERGNAVSGAAD